MTRMSEREYRQFMGIQPKRKYNNTIIECEDGRFDSQREYQRWCELKIMLRAGEIRDLHRQVSYDLTVNGVRVARYVADFVYTTVGNVTVVEDVKGVRTGVYMLKRKLMRAIHGVDIREVK